MHHALRAVTIDSVNWLESLGLSLIPLFVAMDPLGILPLYISLTDGMPEASKRRLVTQATLTALVISVLFLLAGQAVFTFLGITENDFRVGGGVVLLVLAVTDLLASEVQQERRTPDETVGVVPIGIPLIMGPAALTTILILQDQYGYLVTLASLAINLGLVWFAFRQARWIARVLGKAGSRAFAKIAALFLAGIAVMMIRVGLANIIRALP